MWDMGFSLGNVLTRDVTFAPHRDENDYDLCETAETTGDRYAYFASALRK